MLKNNIKRVNWIETCAIFAFMKNKLEQTICHELNNNCSSQKLPADVYIYLILIAFIQNVH